MPGFLSAIFAPADDADTTAATSQHDSAGGHFDLDPSVQVHVGASGTEHHADGSVTDWSNSQDINAHLDIHAVTEFVFDEGHEGSAG